MGFKTNWVILHTALRKIISKHFFICNSENIQLSFNPHSNCLLFLFTTLAFTLTLDSCVNRQCKSIMIAHWQPMLSRSIGAGFSRGLLISSVCLWAGSHSQRERLTPCCSKCSSGTVIIDGNHHLFFSATLGCVEEWSLQFKSLGRDYYI